MILDKNQKASGQDDTIFTENTANTKDLIGQDLISRNRKNIATGQSSYITEISGYKLPIINSNFYFYIGKRNNQVASNVDMIFNTPLNSTKNKLPLLPEISKLSHNNSDSNIYQSFDNSNISKQNGSSNYYKSVNRVMQQHHTIEVLRVIV